MSDLTLLEKDALPCHKCKGWAEPAKVEVSGHLIRGWRCSKCGEEYLHPIDANKLLKENKAKKQKAVIAKAGYGLL